MEKLLTNKLCFNKHILSFILLFLINSVVSEIVTEISESDITAKVLPATEEQIRFLAEDVCGYLFTEQEEGVFIPSNKKEECIRKFTSLKRNFSPHPSKVNFTCRKRSEAKFSAEPSKDWQLVVLVPDDDTAYVSRINIAILDSYQTTDVIPVDNLNYTFWTTVLHEDGTPSIWLRGPQLPPWREGQDKQNVTVEEPLLEIDKLSNKVTAAFDVKFSTEGDSCSSVEIINSCNKMHLGQFFQETVKPISNRTIKIKDLHFNDDCVFSIYSGDNIIYRLKYPTIPLLTPQEPKRVFLEPVPDGETWDIYVRWEMPKVQPEKYNVTLRAPGVFRTDFVDGNTTSYVFEDVEEEPAPAPDQPRAYFNVSIQSFLDNMESALAITRAPFPERADYRTVIVTGSWSAVLTLAAAAVSMMMWWRRRRGLAMSDFYFDHVQDFKFAKECLEVPSEPGVVDAWELQSEHLLLHEVIGEGEFGVVRRGTLAPGGKDVAVKMLKDFPTPEEVRSFRAEIELMKSVGAHPHIVNLLGCCSGRRPMIVAEYCSRGDLLSFLRCSWDMMVSKSNAKYCNNNIEGNYYRNDLFKKQNDKLSSLVVNKLYDIQGICDAELTPIDLLSFCRQIAKGMEFLAHNRVVHRDLAARNILVTADRTLKITDFGLSRDVYQENHYKQKGNGKLPVKWMALESLTRGIYTSQSDVWSFGVVVWEIVTVGAPPYPSVSGARLPRLLRAGYRMPRPANCSKQLYALMQACWEARPSARPTFAELQAALDDLLTRASAQDYITLDLEPPAPPAPAPVTTMSVSALKSYQYIKMLLRGNRVWARGSECYERPLKGKYYSTPSNHYTSPPAPLTKLHVQVV